MDTKDMQGFFADESEIARDDHVVFTYLIETTLDPDEAAANLCCETSTAQWGRPGRVEDFRPLYAAKAVDVEILDESRTSAFGAAFASGSRFTRARVRIAHPHANFGPRIPNLLTCVMGEGAFFCDGISSIKLMDIEFPDSYVAAFQGPQFGTSGIRKILGVNDRPLFFGVVKPNIGLDPEGFAELAYEAWLGGLDAAKDDEMLSDAPYSPFEKRMKQVGEAIKRAEDATGQKKIFIANITDEVYRLKELHDVAYANGINAIMINAVAVGLSGVRALRRFSSVPVVAHFDCIAPMSRHPIFGVSSAVITKLERLCGCDSIIMPGFGERMMTPEEEVVANAAECTKPLGHIKSSLPAPGGSDWAGTLPQIFEKLRTHDFAMVPGRGVFGHPSGPRAGARSLRQSWEAIVAHVPLDEYAAHHPELKDALEAFGGQRGEGAKKEPPLIRGFTGVGLSLHRSLI